MIPFVDYYNENSISPVSQDISDLEVHFNKRESLYLLLGIVPSLLRDKTILEFGPGVGHNSIFTASLLPSKYTLVDGSQVGFETTKSNLSIYKNIEMNYSLFQEFNTQDKYDLVIAEGCLPHQEKPLEIISHIQNFVKKGGIFLLTTANGISYLSETLRRLVRTKLIHPDEKKEDQLKLLTPIFDPHLKTLLSRSRSTEDWILDSIIQPLNKVKLLSIPDVLSHLENKFEFYNSSPKFSIDWRWYKSISNKNKNFNKVALENYYYKNLNLLDYRFEFRDTTVEFGIQLENLCQLTWDLMCEIESDEISDWSKLYNNLNDIHNLIKGKAPKTAQSLEQVISWFQSPNGNSGLDKFESWWGRGSVYLSLFKS